MMPTPSYWWLGQRQTISWTQTFLSIRLLRMHDWVCVMKFRATKQRLTNTPLVQGRIRGNFATTLTAVRAYLCTPLCKVVPSTFKSCWTVSIAMQVAFPRDCGPNAYQGFQWNALSSASTRQVSFWAVSTTGTYLVFRHVFY